MALSGEKLDFEHFQGENALIRATKAELQCIEGHRAYFGHGMKQNYHRAFVHYKKAAELGDADGMNHLAMMMEKGIGCTQNIGDAISHYESAVRLQNDDARYNLAKLLYQNAEYGDIGRAIELYKTAAENGHAEAQTALAGFYEVGVEDYLRSNIQLSIKWYRKAAANGHLEAQNNLAVVMLDHWGPGTREYHEAITLLTDSASAGYAKSQNNLGHCYEFGKGVEKDDSVAFEWYQRAAAQDHAASFVNLGFMHLKRKEYSEAFRVFLKASESGNVESWFYLGLMHSKGYHVPTNEYLAFEYFERASARGHVQSALKLGDCYFSGCGGTAKDYTKAFEIYEKLAINGNSVAAKNLGIMCEDGLGVEVDEDAAERWYQMATDKVE